MFQSRRAQLAIFAVLLIALLGVGYWHVFVHNHFHPSVAAAASQPSSDDTQVDNQSDATAVVTYRADLSTDQAVFDVDIASETVDLTKYAYKSNLVLTDSNLNPLAPRSVSAQSVTKQQLKIRYISNKYPGNHFHFDVRNLGGIDDRVVHFYRQI